MITEATHDHYKSNHRDWELVRRMLTGDDVKAELSKRYFEEHEDHFKQRKNDADFTPLTRRHVSRIVGMLFQAYGDVSRTSPIDLGSTGPEGESYRVQLIELATKLLAYHEAYLVYKPKIGLKVVSPLDVPNWITREYVVEGSRTNAQSVFEDVSSTDTWTRFTPSIYEVYKQVTEGDEKKDVQIERNTWFDRADAFFVDEDGNPTAPVVKVELPWEARFGLLLAKKHRAIFEMRSRRDFAASTSMNGLLQVGTGADEDLAEAIKDAVENSRILPFKKDAGKHQGIAYPTDGIKEGTKILEEKQKELDEIAFKVLNEATRKTATEARLQHTGGAAAALTVLASTIEDADRRILKIMAQAQLEDIRMVGPDARPIDSVTVDWPTDYSGIADAQALIDRVFPSGIPMDAETATTIILDHLEDHGYSKEELDRAAIRNAVEEHLAQESQANSFGVA